jgi:hypothetical protein
MMNPAFELHATYVSWSKGLASGSKTAAQSRSADVNRVAFDHEEHLTAMGQLLQIQAILADMEGEGAVVAPFRKYLPRWTIMLVNYPHTWQAQNTSSEEAFPPGSLDMLQTLGSFIDLRQPQLREGAGDDLRDVARSVLGLIADDDTITPELAAYLSRLAREMDAALEDGDLASGFDVDEAMRRLWVALHAAAGQSTDDGNRSKWRGVADRIFISAGGSALGSAPTIVLGALGIG